MAAVSASDAWAVGFTTDLSKSTTTVILHWNGRKWSRAKSPNPFMGGEGDGLLGATSSSAKSAWAVGGGFTGFDGAPMTMRWDGTSWKAVPTPGSNGQLISISIGPSGHGWAVGQAIGNTNDEHTLILGWNGTAWH